MIKLKDRAVPFIKKVRSEFSFRKFLSTRIRGCFETNKIVLGSTWM